MSMGMKARRREVARPGGPSSWFRPSGKSFRQERNRMKDDIAVQFPLVRNMARGEEVLWLNPRCGAPQEERKKYLAAR